MGLIVNSVYEINQLMCETKEERIQITYEIGDIIEEKCRRCYYNHSSNESFSVNECKACPTGQELRRLGKYLDMEPKRKGGVRMKIPIGVTPEIVREFNVQGIPDKEISIMYNRSFTYVGKLKKKWQQEGLWQGPTNMREIKRNANLYY